MARFWWIYLNVFFVSLTAILCHHNDRCVTKDNRQGICVPQHYCREAFRTNMRLIDTCKMDDDEEDPEEHVCCPLPDQGRNSSRETVSPRIVSVPSLSESTSGRPQGTSSSTTALPRRSPSERTTEYSRDVRPTQSTRQSQRTTESSGLYPLVASPIKPSRRPSNDADRRRKENESAPVKPARGTSNSEGCGQKPYILFIAGGEESKAHSWPWMVAIFRRFHGSSPSKFICGGSLINKRYVLTAAHCFINNYVILPASSFFVRLGSHDLNIGEDYSIQSVVIHPNYTESSHINDIALLRLNSVVYFTDKIAPLCLPHRGLLSKSFVGNLATVAGWGDKGFSDVSNTQVLNEVNIKVVSNEDCAFAYSRIKGMGFLMRGTNHILCAGLKEGGKDACRGDSGGPLMIKTEEDRWTIIGIVSLGYKCAEPDYPGVYTRVTHYLTWVNENMNIS